jgi:hypothetical protein
VWNPVSIRVEPNLRHDRTARLQSEELRRKRRVYTTGRNRQFNIKATAETVERFYKLADEHDVPLGELLELALYALEGAGGSR